MDANVVVAVVAAAGTVVVGFLTYRAGGRATSVNQDANRLAWVKEMGEDAAEARKELKAVRAEAAQLANELHLLVQWIWQPDMTLERLRERIAEREQQRSVGRRPE